MRSTFYQSIVVLFLPLLFSCSRDKADTQTVNSQTQAPLLYQDDSTRRQPYFGDLHVHTAYSLDSYINFNAVGPREAYRFAQGEAVTLADNRQIRIQQPLDFAAVTEHAEYLGELALCLRKQQPQYASQLCQDIRNQGKDEELITQVFKRYIIRDLLAAQPARETDICGLDNEHCDAATHDIWRELQTIADDFYRPGEFTTFIGYEWTGNTNGNNLHRNIIFKDENVIAAPVSYFEATTPLQLWEQLTAGCQFPCEVLAIPHNSNQSKGQQFPGYVAGQGLTNAQNKLRLALEPLVEIIQAKGESECANGLTSVDEFCDFEKLQGQPICTANANTDCVQACTRSVQPKGCVWPNDYVRYALKEGLLYEKNTGINPYKSGMIGSTDTHNGTPGATEEKNYKGHHGVEDGSVQARAAEPKVKIFTAQRLKGSGGLAGVWAEQNSRESLFAALKRKETFATSGTRIILRFFAGWDFPPLLEKDEDIPQLGYTKGVSMGGDLPAGESHTAPGFIVWAAKATGGVDLQRIQIIKGWLDGNEMQEQVYDIACANGSKPDPLTWRCPDNGATVDLTDCSVSQDKGSAELKTVWQDPAFNNEQRAFYYARVLENPSCRWSSYEALRQGRKFFTDVDAVIQERAWSSPIWYTP